MYSEMSSSALPLEQKISVSELDNTFRLSEGMMLPNSLSTMGWSSRNCVHSAPSAPSCQSPRCLSLRRVQRSDASCRNEREGGRGKGWARGRTARSFSLRPSSSHIVWGARRFCGGGRRVVASLAVVAMSWCLWWCCLFVCDACCATRARMGNGLCLAALDANGRHAPHMNQRP